MIRNDRASILGFLQPTGLTLPAPDGTVGTADRPHVSFSYTGIAISGVTVVTVYPDPIRVGTLVSAGGLSLPHVGGAFDA